MTSSRLSIVSPSPPSVIWSLKPVTVDSVFRGSPRQAESRGRGTVEKMIAARNNAPAAISVKRANNSATTPERPVPAGVLEKPAGMAASGQRAARVRLFVVPPLGGLFVVGVPPLGGLFVVPPLGGSGTEMPPESGTTNKPPEGGTPASRLRSSVAP